MKSTLYGFEDYKIWSLHGNFINVTYPSAWLWYEYSSNKYITVNGTSIICKDNSYNRKLNENIVKDHKDLIDTAKTVYVHKCCNISRTLVSSRFKKTLKNSSVPFNLDQPAYDSATYNENVDQWLVLDSYPVDFCQCNGDSYMLTQPMDSQPYMFESSLERQIRYDDSQVEHSFSYEQHPIETYLYKTPEDYGTSSYAQHLSSSSLLVTQEGLADVFTPATAITHMKYNYIVGIDQCMNSNKAYDNKTVYENGDIYGSFNLAKNMYNALYSVDMQEKDEIRNCRRYCGLHNSANSIVLKYYDDVDYVLSSTSSSTAIASERRSRKVPYQKIETYFPQKMSQIGQHKSNVFSVRVTDTGLDDAFVENQDDEYQNIAMKMKKDIMNGIRALSESIAPANTQLFTTYFQA